MHHNPAGILSHANGARHFGETCNETIIAAACSQGSRPLRLLELGAGTAAKTGILLEAAARLRNEVIYIPVDVSSDALDAACASIGCLLPEVQLQPMVANYVTHPPRLERFEGTTLAMYIGSSIGNFPPEEARAILRNLRSELRPGDALLLGTDMVKDESDSRASVRRRCRRHRGVQSEHSASPQSRTRRELRYRTASGIGRAGIAWSHASRCTWRAPAING